MDNAQRARELVKAIEAASESVDPTSAAMPDVRVVLTPEFVERFMNMTRRTGRIEGVRCSIDETEHYAFVLRGFRPGRWLIRARLKAWEAEGDASAEAMHEEVVFYELEPVGYGDSGECVHRILGMNTAAQADRVFDAAFNVGAPIWEGIRLDGATSDQATEV